MTGPAVHLHLADEGGCGAYRMRFPGLALQADGYDVTLFYGEPGDENAGKLQVAWQDDLLDPRIKYVAGVVKPDCDVIVFQRPLRMEMRSIITHIQAHGVAVVVEVDDDFQSIDPRSTAYADCDPHRRPDRNWRHLAACCELADHVIVSTPALARRYGGHGRVSVIPNYVPEWYLDVPKPVHDGPPIVGWTGSVGTHAADLGVVGAAVAELVRSDVCQFRNVGTGWRVAEQLGLDDRYTRFDPNDMKAPLPWWAMGWQDLPDYPGAVASFDVGVVPLQVSQFNEAKCLDVSTRITSSRGFVPIGEIVTGDQVWDGGQWVPVEATNRELPTEGVRVTTDEGHVLELTPNHRMWVNGRWMHAGEIRPGDVMARTSDAIPECPYVSLPWPAESRQPRGRHDDPMGFTSATDGPMVQINERWGRLLGLFVGDGSFAGKTAINIACDGIDADLIQAIQDDWAAIGLCAGTEQHVMFDGALLRRRSVRVSNAHLVRFLQSMGLATMKDNGLPKRHVHVPEIIFRSPRSVIAAFLQGLFEADGSASRAVTFTSKHHQLACDVQRLLNLFGIESRVKRSLFKYQHGRNEATRLTLRRASADVYSKHIGFLSLRKQERLAEIVAKPHSNAYQHQRWADTVVSVEPCLVTPVDLQVQGSVFAASGFVSHNSGLKGLEYGSTASWSVASPTGPYSALSPAICWTASKPQKWKGAIRAALEAHADLGQEAREYIRTAGWTYEAQCGRWWDAYVCAADHRASAMMPV